VEQPGAAAARTYPPVVKNRVPQTPGFDKLNFAAVDVHQWGRPAGRIVLLEQEDAVD
jgi:hypothetical protein